jgi:hypothetical protein
MLSFYDDDSQYPAFFGPKDPTIRGDVVLRHLDWRRVALPSIGISPSQTQGTRSLTCHIPEGNSAAQCTNSPISSLIRAPYPELRIM